MIRSLRLFVVLFFGYFYLHAAVPTSPDLKSPLNNQTGFDEGLFTWKTSTDSDGGQVFYDFYIGTSLANMSLFRADIYDGLSEGDFFAQAVGDDFYFGYLPFTTNTTYYWKVVAKDAAGASIESETWRFSTSSTNYNPPTKPAGPVPNTGDINISSLPALQWTPSTDADGDIVTYELLLDTLATPAIRLASDIASNSFKINAQLKGNKKYYWKVIADDGQGRQTEGDVWSFTTANTIPLPANLVSPADNAVNVANNTTLTWQRSVDPDKDISTYEVWYGITGQAPVKITTTKTTVDIVLRAGANYSWYVMTNDAHGGTATSAVHSFATATAAGNQVPSTPLIVSPVNNSAAVSLKATLQWSAATDPDQDAVWYDLYLGTDPAELDQRIAGTTATSIDIELLPGTTYYWKIVAYDKKGGLSESQVTVFTTTSQDVAINNMAVYYRYKHPSMAFEFLASPIAPAFQKNIASYVVKGRNAMTNAIAVAFYYTNPATTVSFDLPAGFTATTTIPYNFGLPTNASVIYMIEGPFTTNTLVKASLTDGNAQRTYAIDVQVNQLPQKPVRLIPAEGAQNVSVKPAFAWEEGNDPDGTLVVYRVQIGTSPNNLRLIGAVPNNKSLLYQGAGLLPGMKYYWTVTAQDAMAESTASDVYSFVTETAGAVGPPALLYPRAISNYVDTNVELRWQYDPNKNASFELYFDSKAQPQRIAENLTDTRYALSDLTGNTTYYWKIIARNADGTASESPLQKFRTKPLNGRETGVFTDTRDGQIYQWVDVGDARWMVHNLAYQPSEQDGYVGYQYYFDALTGGKEYFALDNVAENIRKYGYLYNWTGAMNATANTQVNIPKRGVCPTGWHIPARAEWEKLFLAIGGVSGDEVAGSNTIYYDTWTVATGKENTWLNTSGLSILPAGRRVGSTVIKETYGQFWLADKDSTGGNNVQYNYYVPGKQLLINISSGSTTGEAGSVRCVQNTNNPPAKPVLKAPSIQSTGLDFDVVLDWNPVTDPEGDALVYKVYADTASTPTKLIAGKLTNVSYTLRGLHDNTTYYWKIEVTDALGNTVESDIWNFTTKHNAANTAPAAPSLVLPANLATDVPQATVFQWAALTDANGDPVVADLYYGTAADDLNLLASNINATTYTVPAVLLSAKTYYWQVVAKDGQGGVTPSAVYQFTTLNRAPAAPVMTAPANGAQHTLLMQSLTWEPATDPDGDPVTYALYTGTSPAALTLYSENINTTYYDFGAFDTPLNTVFYWQVWAVDRNGLRTPGDIWNFRTYVNYDATNAVTLVSPGSGAKGVSLNPVFTWNGIANRKYDLYLQQKAGLTLIARDLTTTSYTLTEWMGESKLQPHTGYAWQVVAKNTTGGVSSSAIRGFTTVTAPPTKPVLTAPANSAVGQPYEPVLQWNASVDADNDRVVYDIVIGTTANPTQVIAKDLVTTEFAIPLYTLLPATRYYWKIIAKDAYGATTTSDIWSFTVQNNALNSPPAKPALLTPVNYAGSTSGLPVLTWAASADIDKDPVAYDVYISTSTTWTTPVVSNVSALTYTVQATLQPHTVYYWKVVAHDGRGGVTSGDTWSFTTINAAPAAATLVSPINDNTVTASTATLLWNASTDPDGDPVTYDVYLDKLSSPATRVAQGLTGVSFITGTLQNNGVYYWKVVTRDAYGAETASAIGKFNGKNEPPQAPSLQSPANNSMLSTASAGLSWFPAADPEGGPMAYEVLFGTDPQPAAKVATVYNTLSFTVQGLSINTTYYWQVLARDDHGATTGSPVWKFSYQPGAPNLPPATPVLIGPPNNQTGTDLQPTLSWNSSTDPEGDPVTYSVYASEDATAAVIVAQDLTTASYTLNTLEDGTKLYWKVVAADDHGNTATSEIWQFTTRITQPATHIISGTIVDENQQPLAGVVLDGFPGETSTDASGYYAAIVPAGWSGQVAPLAEMRTFQPLTRSYTAVDGNIENQDYIASLINGIEDSQAAVLGAYPNPTSGRTHILFNKKMVESGELVIGNILGQDITRLIITPGVKELVWEGTDAAGNAVNPGVYYAQWYAGGRLLAVIKVMILK